MTGGPTCPAVPAAIIPPFRDLAGDDPLLEVERRLREAEGAAHRAYEAVDGAADREVALLAYERAAEIEDGLRELLSTAPAGSMIGAAVKLRMAAAELAVSGYGSPALDCVKSTLAYVEAQAEAAR